MLLPSAHDCHALIIAISLLFPALALAENNKPIPNDFPMITIAGNPEDSAAIRDLFWLHYSPSPKATLWDEWLLPASLWPANGTERAAAAWRDVLGNRIMEPDGYVATHQHVSIAHQHGWPFPFWSQGRDSFGWHFSFQNTIPGWRTDKLTAPAEWSTTGTTTIGKTDEGWDLQLIEPLAVMAPPPFQTDAHLAPFVQLRWRTNDLATTATPFIEWSTDSHPNFSPQRRFYFAPPGHGKMEYTMVPVYRHPQWTGNITGIRLAFDNPTTGARITLQGLFAQYDTRHDVNNPSYVTACIDYFFWTHDLNFLRDNIERMRLAMRFMETEFGTDKDGLVTVPWVGHEGTAGLTSNPDGSVKMLPGRGIGNNYWDLMPFGRQDSYASIRHYGAALKMAALEDEITSHPGWNIAPTPLSRPGRHWRDQAAMGKKNGNNLFWNQQTGRFTLGADSEGKQADFGYTFVNLEAIYYGFATPEHAQSILDWVDGKRIVADDTSQTTDIYRWRFAPRATTRRNLLHYGWFWNDAKSIPFGYQVQDGGAVLGFSYHDIMARLQVLGPDDAEARLHEILDWYREVKAAGGYDAYYDGKKHEGTIQGAGKPGGLGLEHEFFESVMVPQVLLEGFLGFAPTGEGFRLKPRLPLKWPELTINNIRLRDRTLTISATHKGCIVRTSLPFSTPIRVIGPTEKVTEWLGDKELKLP